MIYITGDTHGEHARLINPPDRCCFAAEDTLIICGDFGYLFKDTLAEQQFLDALAQLPYTICFLDGNHENFPAIFRFPEENWNGGRVHRIRQNLFHLMRGQVFTIEGKRLFTFGGAYSIDRYLRKRNVSYWDEELPCNAEYHEATQNLAQYGNCVDYVLTHTAPSEIIRMLGHSPDAHDIELTGFLEYLMHTLQYQQWYFGHWHLDQQIAPKFTAVWFDTIAITEDTTLERR